MDGPEKTPKEETDPGLQALRVIRHDFKTPLTSLRMLGQIFKLSLEKGTLAAEPERLGRNCKMLVDQVDKLVLLADDLYEISVAQSGRMKLERQLADLRPVIQGALAKFEDRIQELDLPDAPVWGQWDTKRLQLALGHLLSEAKSVALVVKASPENEKVSIILRGEFQDAGEKTSPGQYLARQIIEAHEGTLTGRFEVSLPLTCQKSKT